MIAPNELFDQFMTINKQLTMIHHKTERAHGPMGDSTRGQGRVLALLKLRDGVSTRDMAEVMGIRVSSLNETLAKMEEQGFITRTPSEEDKRVQLVELTDLGREYEQPKLDAPSLAFEGFDEEERETLKGYFERIINSLGEQLSEEDYERFEKMRSKRAEFEGKGPRDGRGGRDSRGRDGRGRDGRDGRDGRGGRGGHGHGGPRGDRRGGDRGGRQGGGNFGRRNFDGGRGHGGHGHGGPRGGFDEK